MMKKIVLIFVIIIAILSSFCYIYSQKKITKNKKIASYDKYQKLLDTEIPGTDLASLINESIDKNKTNEVNSENGLYIENDDNSMIIEIKFIESDNPIRGEKIYLNGIDRFIELYGSSNFKCTKVDFHKKNYEIKYLYFEEMPDSENTNTNSN